MEYNVIYEEGVSHPKFQGILYHLYHSTTRLNYFSSLVSTSESSQHSERASATVLIDPEDTSTKQSTNFLSGDAPNSYFTVTFIDHYIRLQSY